jgi:hypothetical protein
VCMNARVSGVNHESKALLSAATFDRSKKRSPFSSSRAGKSSSEVTRGKPIVVAARAARLNSERCNGKPTMYRRYGCADPGDACAMLPTPLTSIEHRRVLSRSDAGKRLGELLFALPVPAPSFQADPHPAGHKQRDEWKSAQ